MTYTVPSDTHAAGDTGHISDHNDIADVLTALGYSNLPLYLAPTGATSESAGGREVTGTSSNLTSETVYLRACYLRQNTVVSNITFCTRGTAETGGSHAWYVLTDSALVVRAVTADQTGATALAAAQTTYTFATNSYTATYSGLYYVGMCITASGMPNFLTGPTPPSPLCAVTPVLCGSSSTSQTTPPSVGATLTALTANNGYNFYYYTS
jgi:hypothetical protein